jgi:hypothetical protein
LTAIGDDARSTVAIGVLVQLIDALAVALSSQSNETLDFEPGEELTDGRRFVSALHQLILSRDDGPEVDDRVDDARCGVCGAPQPWSFNLEYALRATADRAAGAGFPPMRTAARALRPVGHLRSGHARFECQQCAAWWVETGGGMVTYVVDGQRPLLERWNQRPQTTTAAQVELLRRIGPTGYGRADERALDVPCRVVLRNGRVIDMAIVRLSRLPPVMLGRLELALISEVAELATSPFALTRDVRNATLHAGELAMGFAPTIVRVRGRRYVLNGIAQFFRVDDMTGPEVELAGERATRRAIDDLPIVQPPDYLIVVADWRDDVVRNLLRGWR